LSYVQKFEDPAWELADGLLLKLARQWIAGENADDGIERVRRANARGILGLLNLLGEHVHERDQVQHTVLEYLRLVDLIEKGQVDSQVSAKPTQLGINIDYDYCLKNYLEIANACSTHENNWIWVDMEDSLYTDKTIQIYSQLVSVYPNSGIAIQSYLKRSIADVHSLLRIEGKIRLVKGAYNEKEEISFKGKERVRESYSQILETLFSGSQFFAVATHDDGLIEKAKELSKQFGNRNFEFEMLMGVRDSLKYKLVAERYQVREYIPYGPQWLPYSIRRIREKKSNVLLLGRSIFSR
jgi:proline dehydrogenase